jgi:hypothetical protein
MWFGGFDGLFRYDPRIPKSYDQPFRALIRKVVGSKDKSIFGGIGRGSAPAINYAENTLRFEFAAPSFDGQEANRFQVLLEGVDREWSPWSAEAYRDYTNLRERSYRFRVRAKNIYGILSEEGVFSFQILPPWYRTWWAYLGYLLTLVGAARGGLRWRVRRVEAEKHALEAQVAALSTSKR